MSARDTDRRLGILLVLGAAIMWSLVGLFTRLIPLDAWTLTTWRALFGGLTMLLYMRYERRGLSLRGFTKIGLLGLAAAAISGIAMIAYIAALRHTSVAHVMVIYAMTPLFAAGIAYAWMRERVSGNTLIASAIALLGIGAMVGGSAGSGGLLGDFLAFIMTSFFAVILVMARRDPTFSMTPVNIVGALLCVLVCWPLSQADLPSGGELLLLAIFGFATTGCALILYMAGARRLPAAEAGLISLLDTVLAPLWVWLAFDEAPGVSALVGGAIVLGAVAWYIVAEARRPPVAIRQ